MPLSLGSPSLSGHFRVNAHWFRASAWSLNLGTSQGSPLHDAWSSSFCTLKSSNTHTHWWCADFYLQPRHFIPENSLASSLRSLQVISSLVVQNRTPDFSPKIYSSHKSPYDSKWQLHPSVFSEQKPCSHVWVLLPHSQAIHQQILMSLLSKTINNPATSY